MSRLLYSIILSLCFGNAAFAQEVPYHISNQAVYDFIDELANKGVIDINTAIKPYSRMTIAKALEKANGHPALSKRQQNEVAFYLKDFNKELT
ncbi:MAG: hypothetical protein N4A74_05590, partial [Carboxylicivirga sp.]|nr:hypothetical protein [Carboxylicivirga sp.]